MITIHQMPLVSNRSVVRNETASDKLQFPMSRVYDIWQVRATAALSDNFMQRPAARRERINATRNIGISHERRRMMRLEPRIDHQRTTAPPVLVFDKGVNPVDVGRRIRARERNPQEVTERLGD